MPHSIGGVSRPPLVEVFPSSPLSVLPRERLVLHMKATTTTEHTTVSWQYKDSVYRYFINEDPFCQEGLEECRSDPRHHAEFLRQERIRVYLTTQTVQLDGCQTSYIYRLQCYIVIDNVTAEDSGEYVLCMTTTYTGLSPITVTRSVDVSVSTFPGSHCFHYRLMSSPTAGCQAVPTEAICSSQALSVYGGESEQWECELTDVPAASLSLVFNRMVVLPPSEPETGCGERNQVIYWVTEEPVHFCYNRFKVRVLICWASSEEEGQYSISSSSSSGDLVPGTSVSVELEQEAPVNASIITPISTPVTISPPSLSPSPSSVLKDPTDSDGAHNPSRPC
jgi:hypothetical protein